MDVWRSLEEIPSAVGPSAVTLGNFDGVHRGHRTVLTTLREKARELSLSSVVVTFDPHPALVHHPELPERRLSSLEQKLELFEQLGIDAVFVIHYTLAFAQTSPEDFVRDYLVEPFGAKLIVVGSDVRFGWRNSGDIDTMRALGDRFGFEVLALDDVGPTAPGRREERQRRRWSSTWARESLEAGDVEGAAAVIGRWPTVTGKIVHGRSRGRDLGFPTANLGADRVGLAPADGVYAGWMVRPQLPPGAADRVLPTAISVGTNPTFGDEGTQVEAHVVGRDDLDLYGERVELRFVRRIRHMLRFTDPRDLILQMGEDVAEALRALAGTEPAGPSDGTA